MMMIIILIIILFSQYEYHHIVKKTARDAGGIPCPGSFRNPSPLKSYYIGET